MGLYNLLLANITCIHCNQESKFEIEFKNGLLNLHEYQLGDKFNSNKRNPLDTSGLTEGYCECNRCQKDFFVKIKVNTYSVIESIQIDDGKKGYIALLKLWTSNSKLFKGPK